MSIGAVDYGQDLELLDDIGLRWNLVSGQANLAMAIVRRLSTIRGSLYYDESYGFNLLDALNSGYTTSERAALRSQITAEVMKDERVESVATTVKFPQNEIRVLLSIQSAVGPFSLVLGVSALSIDILNAGQAGAPAGIASPEALATMAGPPGIQGPPGVGTQGPQGIPGAAGTASQSFSDPSYQSDDSGTEKVWWQFTFDAGAIPGASLVANFDLLASSASGDATFKLYVGGSFVNLGDAPGGGTLVDTATRAAGGFAPIKLTDTFTNPTGVVPIQITIQSSAAATDAGGKGMNGTMTGI